MENHYVIKKSGIGMKYAERDCLKQDLVGMVVEDPVYGLVYIKTANIHISTILGVETGIAVVGICAVHGDGSKPCRLTTCMLRVKRGDTIWKGCITDENGVEQTYVNAILYI